MNNPITMWQFVYVTDNSFREITMIFLAYSGTQIQLRLTVKLTTTN